jgi:hypothetical protein
MHMSDRVVLITSVYENPELLPHFIHHYCAMGVAKVLVSARLPEAYEISKGLAEYYPVKASYEPAQEFTDSDKREIEDRLLEGENLQPHDWVIYADLDEFQAYPAPLRNIVEALNANDAKAIRGYMVDRLAGDGGLKPVAPEIPIWQQFPVMAHITQMIAGGWTQKVMMTRYELKTEGCVNHTTVGGVFSSPPIGEVTEYRVHHFKWIAGVHERLLKRLAHGKFSGCYYEECRRLVRYLDEHKKLDVTDPAFRPSFCPYSPLRV